MARARIRDRRDAASRATAPLLASLVAAAPMAALALAGLAVSVPLGAYGALGWFARYTADDYCTAGAERIAGYFGAQLNWYSTWSGRYTYYATVSLAELAGPSVVQVLPALAMVGWVAAGAWALQPLARAEGWRAPVLSGGVVSAAIVFAALSGAPYLDQVLFWQTGMLTYLLPLILLTVFAGWLARWIWPPRRRELSWREIVLMSAFLFASAGLSETTLSVQLALVALTTVASLICMRALHLQHLHAVSWLLASGLVSTGLAALVVLAAPGNAVHEISLTGSTRPIADLPQAIQSSVDFVGLFARSVEFRARPAILVLVAIGAALGWQRAVVCDGSHAPGLLMRHALAIAVIGASAWLLLMATITPGYFAQGWDPPERAQFVGVWIVAAGLAAISYLGGRALRGVVSGAPVEALRRSPVVLLWPGVVIAVAVPALADTPAILAQVPGDAAYAAAWDTLDARIRSLAATGQPVVLRRTLPRHFGFDFLGPDPTAYPNPCVAEFYGVPAITAP